MDFKDAFALMKEGKKVKLPEWKGWWFWSNEKKTIIMHLSSGEEMDIRNTTDVNFTFNNICKNTWVVFEERTLLKYPLERGDKGADVVRLQMALMKLGYNLIADGVFGPNTQKNLILFQSRNGLLPDGIFGEKTAIKLNEAVPPRITDESDYDSAARMLGVNAKAIRAVAEVESSSSGFFKDGSLAILFERHWMYRRLMANGKDAEAYAKSNPNVVNSEPGGYIYGEKEHDRLQEAFLIDRDCALESASWGKFQILGLHYKRLGYNTVIDFIADLETVEGSHLNSFVRFILTDNRLLTALRQLDWERFAYYYNGPNNVPRYSKLMKDAYER